MLFVWDWGWLGRFLAVLVLTYGLVQTLRLLPNDEWTWSRWYTYKFGDTAIALFAIFAGVCFARFMPQDEWYTSFTFDVALIVLCIGGSIAVQIMNVHGGKMSLEVAWMPSEIYHTVVPRGFFLAAMIQGALMLVFASRKPEWAFWAAILCLAFYVLLFLCDSFPGKKILPFLPPQDGSPQVRGHR